MVSIKKLKRLLPTLKDKKHYVVFSVDATDKKDATDKLDKAVLDYLGILGYAKSGVFFIDFNSEKQKAIIAVNRKFVSDVKASLVFARFKCLGVSGTLKRAREKFL